MMMMAPARTEPNLLPLFTWPEARLVARMEAEREELAARIARLPRFSHRRIELQARLKDLTGRQLELEARIGRLR